MLKRMISMLLCTAMVFTLLPFRSFAAQDTMESGEQITETESVPENAELTEAAEASVEEMTVPTEAATEPVTEQSDAQVLLEARASTGGTCGTNLTWTLNDAGTLIISGTGRMKNFEDEYDQPWYSVAANVKKVVIETGVTDIGNYAFCRCTALTDVSVPDGVDSIGSRAFSGCSSLKNINIPYGVEGIYGFAFSGCTSLTEITLPDSLLTVWDNAFAGSGLTDITIPDSVTEIGNSAFNGCTKLKTVLIGKNVATLKERAFAYCSSLTTVRFTGNAPRTGANNVFAFSPARVYYPAADSTWTESARNCISTDVTWIPYCEHIWQAATCTAAKTCTRCGQTEGVAVGHSFADGQCINCGLKGGSCGENLTWTLNDAGTLTISGTGAMTDFSSSDVPWVDCRSSVLAVVVEEGVTGIGKYAFYGCKSMVSAELPDTLETIGLSAFYSCSALMDIMIPESVTMIDSHAFEKCTALTGVYITDLLSWCNTDFVHYYSNPLRYAHDLYLNGELITDLIVPAEVTKIGKYTFVGGSFETVTFPEGVIWIGPEAFGKCDGITELNLPNSIKLINDFAFSGCNGLTYVILPDGLATMGENVFNSCMNLKYVYIPDSVTLIENYFNGLEGAYDSRGFCSLFTYCPEDVVVYCEADTKPSGWYDKWNYTSPTNELTTFWGIKSLPEVIPAEISIQSLPDTTWYLLGDEVDLTGLVLQVKDAAGNTGAATEADGVRILSGDASATGLIPVTVYYFGRTATFDIVVHEGTGGEALQPSSGYPESDHSYANNTDQTWTYTCEGAEYLKVTFSSSTSVESSYDFIYLYDGDGNRIGTYTGTKLAGQTVQVSGDTIKIRLDTDNGFIDYGFSLTSIYAGFPYIYEHEAVNEGVYTEPGCTTDGYTTHICFCGETFVTPDVGTAAHKSQIMAGREPTCTLPGLTEGSSCMVCGEILVKQQEIPAAGHTEVIDEAVAPTCIQNGLTEGKHCSVCGAVTKQQEVLEATGTHSFVAGKCEHCGEPAAIPGDLNGDNTVDDSDVEYLLWYTLFPDLYPITVDADFDSNGTVDDGDVEYLLWHTLFPDLYPMN